MKSRIYCLLLFVAIIGNSTVYSQTSWNPQPLAGLKSSVIQGLPCQLKVDFIDISAITNPCNAMGDSCDAIIDWTWDFGDGHTSKLQSPTNDYGHSDFENPYFTVNLKIKTKYGYSDSKDITLDLNSPKPLFKVLNASVVKAGESIFFENLSHSPIFNPVWEWDFGDGRALSEQNKGTASHIYNAPGNYDVYLTMFDEINGTSIRCGHTYPETGAVNTKKVTVTVTAASKISNYSKAKVSIFPNPANDHVFIEGITKGEIVIYDLLGKENLTAELNHSGSMDISTLNKGTYFIKCSAGSIDYMGMFIKN